MKMHWVSFVEAEKEIAGLIGDGLLKRLEHNRVLNDSLLDGIRKRGQRSRERNLLMWMIANGVITSYWITRDGIFLMGTLRMNLPVMGLNRMQLLSMGGKFTEFQCLKTLKRLIVSGLFGRILVMKITTR